MAPPHRSLTGPTLPAELAAPAARVAATIERYELLDPRCRVLVGLSGGRDSTALALLLDALGYEVMLGHVDHAMRPGSERDAAHCEVLAARLGAPFHAVRLDPPPKGEAEARDARYRALEAMAGAAGAARIATGHTLDDAAETVALRLARGGAAIGIPPHRGRVVRPLVELRRRDTEAVCRTAGVSWIDDPSNGDEQHRRNRMRRRAMPALGEAASLRLASVGTDNVVQAQRRRARAETLLAAAVEVAGPTAGRYEIDRAALTSLPHGTAGDLVRLCLARAGVAASERVVRDVVTKVAAVTGASLDLPAGMRAWSDARRVVIGPAPQACRLPEITLAIPGETVSREWGLAMVVEEVDAAARPVSASEAVVDAGVRPSGLLVRQRRPGDRFLPLGGPGHVKLQDLLVDHKVPREDRDRVPVVVSGDEIVWVPGFRVAQPWAVGPRSSSALRLRLRPAGRLRSGGLASGL